MKYDLEQIIDRTGTNSMKWEGEKLIQKFGRGDVLSFWVADMEFKVAEPIIEALRKRVEHGIYGYSMRPDSYYNAIIDWTKTRFGWEIKKEWIDVTPGIVPAINYVIQTFCKPGEKVLIQQPVYYPFGQAIENNGVYIVNNPLVFNGESYDIDFDDFEKKAKDPKVTLFILCSPHNPVSRVWTKEELEKVGKICLDNNVLVVADEIHNDLIFSGATHTMFASINEEFAANSITCTAPSKTFNLAGLQTSNIIIPNEKLRIKFQQTLERLAIGDQNPLSIVAVEAAYREGGEWLEQVLSYLEGNIEFINSYLEKNLPDAKLIKPQATYLGWLDLRSYEENGAKLEKIIIEEAKLGLDGGTWFGPEGAGFMRINYACSRILLEKGLERLCNALNKSISYNID